MLLATSLGGAGHLEPVVAVGRALADDGHEVDLLVPPMLVEAAVASGLRLVVGDDPPAAQIDAIRDRMAEGPPAAVAGLVDRELFATRCTPVMLPAATGLLADGSHDLVLRESCEYASAVAAVAAGVPLATIAISQARIELGVLKMVAPIIDGFGAGTSAALLAAPYLSSFPTRLDPSSWQRTVRYRLAAAAPEPLADWWPGDDRPLVYVTFGGVVGHTKLATRTFHAALDAVARLDARVLLTVGRSFDPDALGTLPPGARAERWVDQASVLAACSVVMCHGGSGTTLGALRAGVPLVVAPSMPDNARNGAEMEAAGARDWCAVGDGALDARRDRGTSSTSRRSPRAARSVRDEIAGYPDAVAAVASLA